MRSCWCRFQSHEGILESLRSNLFGFQ